MPHHTDEKINLRTVTIKPLHYKCVVFVLEIYLRHELIIQKNTTNNIFSK